MAQQYPLDPHQQEIVNIVKAAHRNLSAARKTHSVELARRQREIEIDFARQLQRAKFDIKEELNAEIVAHEAALDDALIVAYNSGIPVRRIAMDGFGNRYDGGVHQLLSKLRGDGRLGSRDNYQRNTTPEGYADVTFPEPMDMQSILTEATTIGQPTFSRLPEPLELVPADQNGENGISVTAVRLDMDSRDPWFREIAKNARVGTPYREATFCTLYEHPTTHRLLAHESREPGAVIWDHPVARWVMEHPEEALAGFHAALDA